jgi:hypothetical protein
MVFSPWRLIVSQATRLLQLTSVSDQWGVLSDYLALHKKGCTLPIALVAPCLLLSMMKEFPAMARTPGFHIAEEVAAKTSSTAEDCIASVALLCRVRLLRPSDDVAEHAPAHIA